MKVSINPAAVFAELDDGAVILNVDTGIYFGLDRVGTRIWTLVGSGAFCTTMFPPPTCVPRSISPTISIG